MQDGWPIVYGLLAAIHASFIYSLWSLHSFTRVTRYSKKYNITKINKYIFLQINKRNRWTYFSECHNCMHSFHMDSQTFDNGYHCGRKPDDKRRDTVVHIQDLAAIQRLPLCSTKNLNSCWTLKLLLAQNVGGETNVFYLSFILNEWKLVISYLKL